MDSRQTPLSMLTREYPAKEIAPRDFSAILAASLPEDLPFYHLGRLRLLPETESAEAVLKMDPPDLTSERALAYGLHGDWRATLVALMDRALDASVYAEAGNLLASMLATALAKKMELEMMITPPRELGWAQLSPLLGRVALDRTYIHSPKAETAQQSSPLGVPIRVLILAIEPGSKGVAHA